MNSVNNVISQKLDLLKSSLDNYLNLVDNVYVVPHKNMDFDCLGSAAGICEIVSKMGKNAFIVTNDNKTVMDPSLKIIYDILALEYKFIDINMLNSIRINQNKELVIVVDINKAFLLPIEENLDSFKNTIVIDHHKKDEYTIESNYSFIESDMSSACEIVYNLMKKYNLKPSISLANALYAGIYLDTRRFGKLNEYIAITIGELMHYGASHDEVKKLFNKNDFSAIREEKRLINDLIDNTEIILNNYAIALNYVVPNNVYSRELLSKTADELIENYDVTASFVIGFTDRADLGYGHSDIIHISARSSLIDVSLVMKEIGGGGRFDAAAADFYIDDIYNVNAILKNALTKILLSDITRYENPKKLVLMPLNIKRYF